MTYFADLTPYGYHTFQPIPDPKLLNVGWLDASVPFAKGPVDALVVPKLLLLRRSPVNLYRGWQGCPFGQLESPPSPCPYPVSMLIGIEEISLANGEIRVPSENGIVYAAPTLICHYIDRHRYCPPNEFLMAVSKL
jgi:hypothetical protein